MTSSKKSRDVKGRGLDRAQKAAMEMVSGMDKPDVAEARRTLELGRSLGLPGRVTLAMETYIELANNAGVLADEAREAAKDASGAWREVRDQAGHTEDLVDLAEEAAAGEASKENNPEPAVGHGEDASGDALEGIIGAWPQARPLFGSHSLFNVYELLHGVQASSNDTSELTLKVAVSVAMKIMNAGEANPGRPARVICGAIVNVWLDRLCDAGEVESWLAPFDWRDVMMEFFPKTLDVLGGEADLDKACDDDLRRADLIIECLGTLACGDRTDLVKAIGVKAVQRGVTNEVYQWMRELGHGASELGMKENGKNGKPE